MTKGAVVVRLVLYGSLWLSPIVAIGLLAAGLNLAGLLLMYGCLPVLWLAGRIDPAATAAGAIDLGRGPIALGPEEEPDIELDSDVDVDLDGAAGGEEPAETGRVIRCGDDRCPPSCRRRLLIGRLALGAGGEGGKRLV